MVFKTLYPGFKTSRILQDLLRFHIGFDFRFCISNGFKTLFRYISLRRYISPISALSVYISISCISSIYMLCTLVYLCILTYTYKNTTKKALFFPYSLFSVVFWWFCFFFCWFCVLFTSFCLFSVFSNLGMCVFYPKCAHIVSLNVVFVVFVIFFVFLPRFAL